jgi:hypothetical protein
LGFLSLWELLLVTIYLLHCHCLAIIQSKIPKTLASFIVYLSFLITNTFSSSWVRQPFLFERYYNWSPALGSHQDTFLAPLPGSVALLVRSLVRKLESWILFTVLSHCYYGISESCLAAPCFIWKCLCHCS